MVTYLSKKSYQRKNLKEVAFKDLWGDIGIFTTMWIFGNPAKILFFKAHIKNLIRSVKIYHLNVVNLEKDILRLLKINIKKNIYYNHLLRIAVNKNLISISLRKRLKPNLNFNLRLINYKRNKPEFKNLKYQIILKYLSKMNNSNSDIGLCNNKMIYESGTSNIFFIKENKVYSPINKIYKGITLKFFEKKIDKIYKRNIFINTLQEYDEIILIGSGKGVASVNTIDEIKWKRKSLKFYKILLNLYKREVLNCSIYK